jgi:hypothetical protein
MDVEAIRNLGSISKSLLTGTNYHSTTVGTPGQLTIPADNTVFSGNLTVTGNVTFLGKDSQSFTMNIMPIGTIIAFANVTIPRGWAKCDGTAPTPDLRGRFILGEGPGYVLNRRDGEETHRLSVAEMPSHAHTNIGSYGDRHYSRYSFGGSQPSEDNPGTSTSGHMGGNEPHNNMPPYHVLIYIMKTS